MQIRRCHPGPNHVLILNCAWVTIPSKTRARCLYMLCSSLSVNANELHSNQHHKTGVWLRCSLSTVKMTLIVFPSNLIVKELLVPPLQLNVDPYKLENSFKQVYSNLFSLRQKTPYLSAILFSKQVETFQGNSTELGRAMNWFVSWRKRAVLFNPAWYKMYLVVFLWWFPSLLVREDQVWSLEYPLCRKNADLVFNWFIAGNLYAKCLLGKPGFSFYLFLITPVSWHKF